MGFLAAPLAIAGVAMNVMGSVNKGESEAASAEYNAQVARQNATVADQQGEAAAESQAIAARRKIGSMVASYGASGVDGTSGSPMDVLADSVRMATLDNLTTKYNYKLKAMGYRNQAALDDSNAANARTSGYMNAASGLFKGVGSAIPKFGDFSFGDSADAVDEAAGVSDAGIESVGVFA